MRGKRISGVRARLRWWMWLDDEDGLLLCASDRQTNDEARKGEIELS